MREWNEVRLAKVSALAQSSARVRLRGIVPAPISLPLQENGDGGFIITFLIIFLITFPLTDTFEASTICSINQAFERGQEESAMQQRFYSRLALRTLLKLRTCAEGSIAREWTCWKPRSKAHDRAASDRPPTIQRTLYNTTCGRTVALRDLMPFLTSAW
jgi:hypothetical protein